ncbi:MAG: alpha/beta hydrolase [Jiangellaceae bacterium]
MSTFALIHGAGDVGRYWHLVEAELRTRGHDVVAPDLPGDDDAAELTDYADAVVEAVGGRKDLVVVGQSFGAFTASLVPDRLPVDALVLVAGMIPSPGESPGGWWDNTGYRNAVREQAARDGGLTGNEDPHVSFYHDVPRELAEEAMSKERAPARGFHEFAVAARRVAGRADEVRAVHRGSLLPARLPSQGGSRAAERQP